MFSEIVLFGMPNSGKSTVFNALTGGNAKVGNWHGVTVEIKEGKLKGNTKVKVYDLPGVYSLYPVTLEEKSAINKVSLTNGLIVAIIEASTISIALESVFALIRKNKRVLVAVNMVKELYRSGGSIDFDNLSKILPVPIVYGEFNTKKGVQLLLDAIINYSVKKIDGNGKFLTDNLIKKYFTPPKYKENLFDKFALNKFFGYLIFLGVFVLVFYIAFGNYGIGKPLSNFLYDAIVVNLKEFFSKLFIDIKVNKFLTLFVIDGIIEGLGGIFIFLPETLILFISLTFLELTGYMSRVAYLFDDLLKKTGLNGRAIFSLLMGLGCTAVAVTTTNGLENNKVRKNAVISSGMISCSAKIPALMLIASSVSSLSSFSFMLLIYFIGLILTFIQIKISNKLVGGERVPLIMELPKYRAPKLSDLLKETYKSIKGFLVKICTVIFLISCGLFLLKSLSLDFKFIESGFNGSLLYYLGGFIKYIFYPIGVYDWRIGSCVISGIFAKEGVATTIISLYNGKLPYSFASIMALAVFFYVYTPCITALAVVAQSLGLKFSFKFALLQFLEGLILCYFTYYVIVQPLLILLLLPIIFYLFVKKKSNKSFKVLIL